MNRNRMSKAQLKAELDRVSLERDRLDNELDGVRLRLELFQRERQLAFHCCVCLEDIPRLAYCGQCHNSWHRHCQGNMTKCPYCRSVFQETPYACRNGDLRFWFRPNLSSQ